MDEEKIIDNIKTFGSERYSAGYKDAINIHRQKKYESKWKRKTNAELNEGNGREDTGDGGKAQRFT